MKVLKSILILLFVIIALRSLNFLFQSLDWPLEYCIDMILMKFFAWSWNKGHSLYTDIYTYNLPVTVYINYIWLKLFGGSSFSMRSLDVVWNLFVATSCFIYLKKYSKLIAFFGFCLSLTLLENATNFGAFQRETMMLPFLVISMHSIEKFLENKQNKFLILFSFCTIISFFIKPTAILLFILLCIYYFYKVNFSVNLLYSFILNNFIYLVLCTCILSLPFLMKGNLLSSVYNWYSYFKDLSIALDTKSYSELLKTIFSFSPRYWNVPLNQPVLEFNSTGHFGIIHLFFILFYFIFLIYKKVPFTPLLLLLCSIGNYLIQAKGFAYHLFLFWFSILLMSILLIHAFLVEIEEEKKGKPIYIILVLFFSYTHFSSQSKSLKFYKGTGLYTIWGETKKNLPKSFLSQELILLERNFSNKPIKVQVFETYHSISLATIMELDMQYASRYPEAYIFYSEDPRLAIHKQNLIQDLNSNVPDLIILDKEGRFNQKRDLFKTFPEIKTFLKNYKYYKEIEDLNNVHYQIYLKK
jgi:hypothetical protein